MESLFNNSNKDLISLKIAILVNPSNWTLDNLYEVILLQPWSSPIFKIKQLYQNILKKFRLKYENNSDHLIGSNPFLSSLIIILYP